MIGCCGSNIKIKNSELDGISIGVGNGSPVTGPFILENSLMLNSTLDLPSATVEIRKSSIYFQGGGITLGNGLIDSTELTGNSNGTGLKITGYYGYNIGGTVNIKHSTISNFDKGIQITGASTINIQHNNILNNATYNIENVSPNNITGTFNWWGTTDNAEIAKLLYEKNDDINKGEIVYTNYLSDPNDIAPVIPPVKAVKQANGNDVILDWQANKEKDLSGYKVYYGYIDGLHFNHVVDVGNVTTYTLVGVSANDSISVTAYDKDADSQNDQIEGHESWYSKAGYPQAQISLSSTTINMGAVQIGMTGIKKLLITNKGTANLIISNIAVSNNLFKTLETSLTIRPDSSRELAINFSPLSLGQVTGTLTLTHNSKSRSSVLSITGIGVAESGTGICGVIEKDTIWKKTDSPYYVLCDIQIPTGVTLTIEPGVEIRYTGDYEILIKGKLIANGTPSDTIVFRSDVNGVKKGKRFLNFENTDLATHQVSYIKIVDGNIGIQVGDESEYQPGNKNTGVLTVNHLRINNANILTSGVNTNAELLLNNGMIENSQVIGEYPSSEKIYLNKMRIRNCQYITYSIIELFSYLCRKRQWKLMTLLRLV